LELLERAVSVALSPLNYSGVNAWGEALTAALCPLAGSTAGAVLVGDSSGWRAVTHPPSGTPLDVALHEEATERFLASGTTDLVFWAKDDLANCHEHQPISAACGTVGVRVKTSDGTVAAACVHRDRALGPLPYHVIAALRAIAPAFRAGVAAWANAQALRTNIARMLDALSEPALMFDAAGTLMHANPSVPDLTSGANAARLRNEAQRIAWSLGASVRRRGQATSRTEGEAQAVRRVQIGGTVYSLRGSLVGEQLLGAEPAVLVTMVASAPAPLTDDTLASDYDLTPREIQVARLIAEGLSNTEIAERLGVKFFTARNHVERTLSKLGVPSRHRVGPLLRNEASDSERASAA
jgi:DNA-binding CsgD family transcriptional regulator